MEASGGLNDLANYSQLLELSERIGYAVSKVVFRGYQAGDKLQVSVLYVFKFTRNIYCNWNSRGGNTVRLTAYAHKSRMTSHCITHTQPK